MIRKEDLLEAIAECNGVKNPNANTCIMLSAYYTILDHMQEQEKESVIEPMRYSYSAPPETVEYESDTEFGERIANKNMNEVLAVVDELMSTLQVLYPKLYAGVMRKIAE